MVPWLLVIARTGSVAGANRAIDHRRAFCCRCFRFTASISLPSPDRQDTCRRRSPSCCRRSGPTGSPILSKTLPVEILRAVNMARLMPASIRIVQSTGAGADPRAIGLRQPRFIFGALVGFRRQRRDVRAELIYCRRRGSAHRRYFCCAWQLLRKRYGNLTLDRSHGLARPMPRFAAAILAPASWPPSACLPSRFSSAISRCSLQPSSTISSGLGVILLTWFFASWYLFRMMQRLLFGRHRADMRYEDLRTRRDRLLYSCCWCSSRARRHAAALARIRSYDQSSSHCHGDDDCGTNNNLTLQRKPADGAPKR